MGFYYFSTTSLLWWWNLPLFVGWNPYKLPEPMEWMFFVLCSAFCGRLTVTSHPGPSFGMIVQCLLEGTSEMADGYIEKIPWEIIGKDHEITPCPSNHACGPHIWTSSSCHIRTAPKPRKVWPAGEVKALRRSVLVWLPPRWNFLGRKKKYLKVKVDSFWG